eukprot:Seg172.5 transcript_id=Seg172.5/GoldUCD/mRNA.D3Y31 product="Tubulin-specific chaperone E" protein_id=Seg172.5/GoldUCD/D3Y31
MQDNVTDRCGRDNQTYLYLSIPKPFQFVHQSLDASNTHQMHLRCISKLTSCRQWRKESMFKMNSFIMVLMMCQVCLCLGKARRPSMSDIATSAQVPTKYNRPHHKDGLPYLPISLKELRLANRLSSRRSLNSARANGVFTRKLLNALDQDADSKNLVKESKKSGRKRIFSKAAITNDQSFQRARNILDLDMRDPAAEEKLEYLVKSEDLDGKKKEERFPQSFESLEACIIIAIYALLMVQVVPYVYRPGKRALSSNLKRCMRWKLERIIEDINELNEGKNDNTHVRMMLKMRSSLLHFLFSKWDKKNGHSCINIGLLGGEEKKQTVRKQMLVNPFFIAGISGVATALTFNQLEIGNKMRDDTDKVNEKRLLENHKRLALRENRYQRRRDDGYGSFVRPHKLNLGIDIIDALQKRYASFSDEVKEEDLYLFGTGHQKVVIEAVGFDKVQEKQRQLRNLQKASLIKMCISNEGEDGKFMKTAPNIIHLDISNNLFHTWKQIASITEQLRHLTILNLSENRLSSLENCNKIAPAFQSLKTIFANRMQLSWKEVVNLLLVASNLEELHICFNSIHQINCSDLKSVNHLKLLNLEGNRIDNWDEIMKLTALKSLETLILNDNNLSKIEFPRTDGCVGFESLKAISLSHNTINQWLSINELANLPSLANIKFKSNSICKDRTTFDIRQEIIARLKNICIVNGSEVPAQERKEAELIYLKRYCSEWLRSGGSQDDLSDGKMTADFVKLHPRFVELVKAHGAPVENVKKLRTLKDSIISLQLKCPNCDDKKPLTKKIPVTMTVQQLKSLSKRLFRIKSLNQQLSYLDAKTQKEVEMEDNLRDLAYYSISENDIVLIRW